MTVIKAPPGNRDHVLAMCHMLSNRTGKAFSPLLGQYDTTISEWRVIMSLARLGPLTGQEITDRWAMDKMAVNRAINKLVNRGLMDKQQNQNDRRAKLLVLTPSGRSLHEQILPATMKRFQKLMECLDDTEEKQLSEILSKMIAHADVISE